MTGAACKEQPTPLAEEKVTAWIAAADFDERDCLRMYACTQSAVQAEFLSAAEEFSELARQGMPQVLVLDALMPDAARIAERLRLVPPEERPVLLLIAPLPESPFARRLLHTQGAENILTRPYRVTDLFETIYTLGANSDSVQLFRVKRRCRAVLRALQADPTLSGTHYLERMVQYALVSEQELPPAELYELIANEQGLDVRAVTAAVDRLARALQAQSSPAYQALCARYGFSDKTKLSNGRLIRAVIEQVRDSFLF